MSEFDHSKLNRVIHSRIRLAVMACLAAGDLVPFTLLRQQTGTTDGNLSVHLRKLEKAGYIRVEKTFNERKPLTRYALTPEGNHAFRAYVDSLESLLLPGKSQR